MVLHVEEYDDKDIYSTGWYFSRDASFGMVPSGYRKPGSLSYWLRLASVFSNWGLIYFKKILYMTLN